MDGGKLFHHVLQKPQLRPVAVLQKYFLTAIVIEIGEGKRAPVFQKIQPDDARNVGERSVAIVRVENISLVAAPGAISSDQFVNRAPSLFVSCEGFASLGELATTCRQKKLFRSSPA
jgi:hypothetical protein